MNYEITNTGRVTIFVINGLGSEVPIDPGQTRIGGVASIKFPPTGRIEFTCDPVKPKK